MRLLLDTHLLLWMAGPSNRLSPKARTLIADPANELVFSAISIWETVVKKSRRRPDFVVDPQAFRTNLIANSLRELHVTADHALAVMALPPIHRDPFDRMLVAQAVSEGLTLLTSDDHLARYPGPILRV